VPRLFLPQARLKWQKSNEECLTLSQPLLATSTFATIKKVPPNPEEGGI